jgi:phage-related protein
MADSYAINGVALTSLMTVNRVDGGIHAPTVLQDDYLVPGRRGAIATTPWIGPSPLTIYGTIIGTTRADYLAKARAAVAALFNSGNVSTITRTILSPSGSPQVATARVRYVTGLEAVEELSNRVGRIAVEFTMLSGTWLDEDYVDSGVKSGTFTLNVPGDQAATEVILEFAGGTAQKLANTTRESFLEFGSAITTGTAVVVDSGNFTVTQGTVDVSDDVTYSPALSTGMFLLSPGVNSLTLTGGGTVKLKFKGSYL